jgi:hypothetical protein
MQLKVINKAGFGQEGLRFMEETLLLLKSTINRSKSQVLAIHTALGKLSFIPVSKAIYTLVPLFGLSERFLLLRS